MKRLLATLIVVCWSLPTWAVPVLSSIEARLETGPPGSARGSLVHLLSGGLFGTGGIARGLLDLDNGDGPTDVLWLVQSLEDVRPPDASRVLRFTFDDTGNFLGIEPTPFYDPDVVAGVEPSPFRIFLAEHPPDPIRPAALIGELDFRAVSGVTLGSLNDISGLRLVNRTDGGANVTFASFSIRNVPEPATLALCIGALAGVGVVGAARSARRRATT